MIISFNNGDDRHIPSWSRHRKASFSTPGAMQSTLVHIAEQVKKLAFHDLSTFFRLGSTPPSGQVLQRLFTRNGDDGCMTVDDGSKEVITP